MEIKHFAIAKPRYEAGRARVDANLRTSRKERRLPSSSSRAEWLEDSDIV